MRVLVTGAAGFVGRHLTAALRSAGHTPLSVDQAEPRTGAEGCVGVDIMDREALGRVLNEMRPDAAIHLAALSFVPDGESKPAPMLATNIAGTLNVLDGMAEVRPGGRVLLVSSSQVYGPARDLAPLDEGAPVRPVSMYAVSKAAAELAALGRDASGVCEVIIARPANHTGPGQTARFVVPAFIEQLKACRAGRSEGISVGNLDSVRDFTDVRDVVAGYVLLLEHGRRGAVYNLTADVHLSIGDLLDRLCELAGLNPPRIPDPGKMRPTDQSPHLSIVRLFRDTGWTPRYKLDETLRDMLAEPA